MKNKLIDLNNHLFSQLERLSSDELEPESIKSEIERSKAVASLATQVISNARLVLDAHKALSDGNIRTGKGTPKYMLGMMGDMKEDQ
jgi:hypothetical protein